MQFLQFFFRQRQQTRHRTFGGAIHTDRAIFIKVHKAEGLINPGFFIA